jgi:NADPH:quinone reductase-like Zn-dependent oxidoreductase
MKAIQFTRYGGPEVLELVEVDEPRPGPGEVRIAVRAAGVNAIDWKLRSGELHEAMPVGFPSGTGLDAAGVVDEIGEGVDGVRPGDAVFGSGSATLAEHAVLTEWAPVPQGLSFEEAGGYGVPVETAFRILDQVGVKTGETLLVSGAAGGVGSAVIQIARLREITVIGTASAANHAYIASLGALPTGYGDGMADRVRDLAPEGIHAALDVAGSGVIPELVALTGDPTKVVSIADFSALALGAQFSAQPVNRARALREAARLFSIGAFRLPVASRYPLADARRAHRDSAAGHVAGRRVVTV